MTERVARSIFLPMKKAFKIESFDKSLLNDRVKPFCGNVKPFDAILEALAQPPYNCKTVVTEEAYVDKDYQDEYSAFYCRAFKFYGSRCVRLHFFSCDIPADDICDLGKFAKAYLGYTVIRPTDLQRVGRTVLLPSITDSHHQFVHCCTKCTTHILGEELTVTGMPFIQQDTQVGACAQASLWMLSRYMSLKFGYREYLPSEINQLAKANIAVGRPLPAERGLNSWQMLDALKGMGIAALLYTRTALGDCSPHIENAFPVDPNASQKEKDAQLYLQTTVKLADIAYRYVESGLPVIVGTNNHALVAIGHTYESQGPASVTIQRIPAFYVNNDNTGPYREMPILTISATDYSFCEVVSIIPVLPHEVTLRGEEAEAMARVCIDQLLDSPVPNSPTLNYRDFISQSNPALAGTLSVLEYRTFLQASVEFQASLRRDMAAGKFNADVGMELLSLDYPKYIWVTEASSSTLLNHLDKMDRKCVGRVIVDSTAPAKTEGVIALHIADFLQLIDRSSEKPAPPTVSIHLGSTPFGHKVLCQA